MTGKLTLMLVLSLLLLSCSDSFNSFSNANETREMTNNSSEIQGQELPISATAIMGKEEIELEVTKTPEQQQIGLMFRQSLNPNRGMLFSFSPARITRFWMKNVVIPLDMIFIQEGKIKAIGNNIPPCKVDPCPVYGPDSFIDTVIELKGGRASELGLKIGDMVKIKFIDNSQTK